MIDFNYKILNSDKFRGPAIEFQRTGKYCAYPINTSEYLTYWEEERKKCIYGWHATDGDFITGYNYFYLNYSPITQSKKKTRIDAKGNLVEYDEDIKTFPKFYDYDYYYFLGIDEAELDNEHMVVAKSRRKGYSVKGGSMCCRNYFLIPDSKSYIYASSKEFLVKDGTLTKAWDIMDFLDEHTAWAKKRQYTNTSMHRRASYQVTDQLGNKREDGYKSEIIGVTLKDNPNIVRGKRAKLILFEEAGSCSELAQAWQIAKPSVENSGRTIGIMIAFGTGGDEKSDNIRALKNMFYNPMAYGCKAFYNIWDDGMPNERCGFFVPQHTNMPDTDADGNYLYMDKDGNTLHAESINKIYKERAASIEQAKDSESIDRYIAERSECPMEAFMELKGNIFPKKDLQIQLARIRTNRKLQNHKQVGHLSYIDGIATWNQSANNHGDITTYYLDRKTDTCGAVVIWEHPRPDTPPGMYIIGVDPYDHDDSGTTSLGSCFVYKRFQDIEEYHDILVAEYTGRPKTAEEFYENVRKLAIYYNARIMYENMNKGLFTYFTNRHCDYLLADQPDILNDIISGRRSMVNRRKGCHMTKEIKLFGERLIKEWLEEEISPGVSRISQVFSEPLLEELISYNNRGNFDRIMAIMQVMIYREQLYRHKVKEKADEEKRKRIFDKPLFTEAWFVQEAESSDSPLNVFKKKAAEISTNFNNTTTYYYGAYS